MREFKNILVTGGAGFIGSNFILNFLKKNKNTNIINIDNLTYAANLGNLKAIENAANYKFIECDISDFNKISSIFTEEKIDCVVNFAAESHVDRSIDNPNIFLKTNVIGTANLLNASLLVFENNKEFLFHHISTDEVYGSLSFEDKPFKETNQYLPNSPYSASKASSDHLVRAWNHTYGLPTTLSNCSNNYGPFQHPEKLIPFVIKQIITDKPITLYGDGLNIRDWLYVEDHCRAIQKIIFNGEIGSVYNIGGINEKSNVDLVHTICDEVDKLLSKKTSSKELITFIKDRPGHDRRYAIDNSKIQEELNWQPKETFNSGIIKTVSWYLKNQDWLLEK